MSVAKEIFEHCRLNWHTQSEDFIRQASSSDTDDFYSIKRDPAKAAGRWRTELSSAQIERIIGVTRQTRCGAMFSE